MPKLARVPANDGAPETAGAAVRHVRRPQARYYAFLSYSHKDQELADWLHRQLEEFRVPHSLAGKLTANGVIPRRLAPIFRDQHELSAADDLGEEIREALDCSQYLIVLCSPDAAKSRWTNAEIEAFKKTRPDGCVLAAIAFGEPFASDIAGREAEECFPPALRQKYDRRGRPTGKRAEPLAADLRGEGEGRRTGFLKLVAGMLGVGLDDLVQRETTRRHRRLAWLAAASLGGMAVTSALAVTAIQARDAARDQRREAEGLVAFMLGDLKDKLEPIGRLDALDGVGSRILAYYSKQDTSQLSDAALLQRSRALSLMGQVANVRGNSESAMRFYHEAMAGTAEAIRRNPHDPQRLYDHAQNVFWVGSLRNQLGDLAGAESAMRQYAGLARQMVGIDPNNMQWRMEIQDSEANLGFVLYQQRKFPEAAQQFGEAVQMVRALATADPHNREYQRSLAEALAWLADAQLSNGSLEGAIRLREEQVARLQTLSQAPNADVLYQEQLIPAEETLGWLYSMRAQNQLALDHFNRSLAVAGQLTAREPDNAKWLGFEMATHFSRADALLRVKQTEAAAQDIDAGCGIAQGLLRRDSQVSSWRSGERKCWMLRAQIALARNNDGEALQAVKRAIALAAAIKTGDPAGDKYGLARAYMLLGDVKRSGRDDASASTAWRKALDILPAGVAEQPAEMDLRAAILQRVGDRDGMRRIETRLNTLGYHRMA